MRASIVGAFGCTLGIIPHMAAPIMGLAALLHASALAFQTLKYLGVAYLLYMAWNTLREQGALQVNQEADTKSAGQVIVSAILMPHVHRHRQLRALCRQNAQPGPRATAGGDVDAPGVRRRFCRARRQTRAGGSLKSLPAWFTVCNSSQRRTASSGFENDRRNVMGAGSREGQTVKKVGSAVARRSGLGLDAEI